jgi:hypothetical protein
VFAGRRIETAVLLLLPASVAARMFTGIPLLLEKWPICHNINAYSAFDTEYLGVLMTYLHAKFQMLDF